MREYTYARTNPIIDDSWIGTLKTDGNNGSKNINGKNYSNGSKNTSIDSRSA